MKISEKEVRYIADLAHLNLDDDEVQGYQSDLEEILEYVEKLDELDTAGVEPMSHAVHADDQSSSLREDELRDGLSREEALANAPLSGAGHFKVPLVIER